MSYCLSICCSTCLMKAWSTRIQHAGPCTVTINIAIYVPLSCSLLFFYAERHKPLIYPKQEDKPHKSRIIEREWKTFHNATSPVRSAGYHSLQTILQTLNLHFKNTCCKQLSTAVTLQSNYDTLHKKDT